MSSEKIWLEQEIVVFPKFSAIQPSSWFIGWYIWQAIFSSLSFLGIANSVKSATNEAFLMSSQIVTAHRKYSKSEYPINEN